MVIVKLLGGLGNQMFQYAAGRRLAQVLETELTLDITRFERDPLRAYSLSHFHIQERFATQPEIESFFLKHPLHALLKQVSRRFGYTVIKESPRPSFVPQLLSATGNVYLKGFWQSEQYFQDIRPLLLQEFEFKDAPDVENQSTLAAIQESESVALHIRRGDYVTDAPTNQMHGLCSLAYYQQAIETIAARVSQPSFFVFSDEPDWAKAHVNIPYPTCYVTHNSGENGHEDLRLMRQCKHFIAANSSFSWWGAWLAEYAGKIVIAPKQWFRELPPDANADHIVPKAWIRL